MHKTSVNLNFYLKVKKLIDNKYSKNNNENTNLSTKFFKILLLKIFLLFKIYFFFNYF